MYIRVSMQLKLILDKIMSHYFTNFYVFIFIKYVFLVLKIFYAKIIDSD